jgi:hypothetical protein
MNIQAHKQTNEHADASKHAQPERPNSAMPNTIALGDYILAIISTVPEHN